MDPLIMEVLIKTGVYFLGFVACFWALRKYTLLGKEGWNEGWAHDEWTSRREARGQCAFTAIVWPLIAGVVILKSVFLMVLWVIKKLGGDKSPKKFLSLFS